jgi:TonB family protein
MDNWEFSGCTRRRQDVDLNYNFKLRGDATNQWCATQIEYHFPSIEISTCPPDLPSIGLDKIGATHRLDVSPTRILAQHNVPVAALQGTEFAVSAKEADTSYASRLPILSFRLPDYPRIARQAGVQGAVRVAVSLASDCHVLSQQIEEGNLMLQHSVEEAVREWRFANCPSEVTIINLTFKFVLFGEKTEDWTPTFASVLKGSTIEIRTTPFDAFVSPYH